MNASIIFNGKMISGVIDGKRYDINDSNPRWLDALLAYKEGCYKKLAQVMNLPEAIQNYTCGKVKVKDGNVYYNGNLVHGTISTRILNAMKIGVPHVPLVRFLNNLYKNPDEAARNELYDFLEKGGMPPTDDGCFLAYKKVGPELRAFHANPDGSYNHHKIGVPIKIKRADCDISRASACSRGLHFCAFDYLEEYVGRDGWVVVMKINPKDVTAVPSDYNFAKARCCEYVTVNIHGKLAGGNILAEHKLFSGKTKQGKLRPYQVGNRDKFGRFYKKGTKMKPLTLPKQGSDGKFLAAKS